MTMEESLCRSSAPAVLRGAFDYFAARDVPAGEELCIYYGPDEELWFDVK